MAADVEMAAEKRTGEPTDRLGFLLAHHGAIADRRVRGALGVTGLTPRHAMTLMYLADGPVTQQALIEVLGVDPSVVVTLLNDLERDDLARRRRDPADRRRHIVEITPEGTTALKATDAALTAAEEELFADLSARDRTALRRLLTRIRTAADDYACD
ncbi:MarR family winged helix-turn-helix transcriptional regulator [Streptomyces sp. NPDC015346]|uniref:MarR family winged helix-turn-helix transcriptional regulator n=1 Tax=Streptomyces sp. NPDC015346 TaxID=3364954 RepID=UPI0036FCB351